MNLRLRSNARNRERACVHVCACWRAKVELCTVQFLNTITLWLSALIFVCVCLIFAFPCLFSSIIYIHVHIEIERESGREKFSITYSSMNLFNIEKVLCVEYVIIIRVKSKNCTALCRKLIDAHLCIHIDGSELCQSNYTFIFFMHKIFIFRYSYILVLVRVC